MRRKYLFTLPLVAFVASGCTSGEKIPTSIDFTLKGFANPVEYHTQEQLDIFINNFSSVIDDTLYNYLEEYNTRLLSEDMTLPLSVELSWEAKSEGGKASKYTVMVSEDENFSSYEEYTSKELKIDYINLKRAATYYWKVKAYTFESEVGEFTTSDTLIRNVKVDGVNNVRDIGGYGHIKQGMIYRGGAFEKYNSNTKKVEIKITQDGINTIKNQLHIKTEVDLRRDDPSENENCGLTKSTVSELNYVPLPMQYGGKNILTEDDSYHNPAKIKAFFELLADSNNYPVYMHCSQGKDRTGCLAYLIEALMGVETNSLYMDYLFSSMSNYNNRVNRGGIDNNYGKTLTKYGEEGWTLAQKTYNYLHEVIGVSEENLNSVKSILAIM